MNQKTNQSGARAGGHMAGQNLTITEHHHYPEKSDFGVIPTLLEKLKQEIDGKIEINHYVDSLGHFNQIISNDDIKGLEEKLKKADRAWEIPTAIDKKELFAKFLEKFALYGSAQEIIACILAKAEYEFTHSILPNIHELSPLQVGQLIEDKIILPAIKECGTAVFVLNHSLVMGMLYWLAERCRIKWHI